MPAHISELTFLEHLAGRFNIPVPEHLSAEVSAAQIRQALKRWGGRDLVKPDVLAVRRACDLAFITFALGRAAGAAGEFLDHQDFGSPMDMRIPVSECEALTRPKD